MALAATMMMSSCRSSSTATPQSGYSAASPANPAELSKAFTAMTDTWNRSWTDMRVPVSLSLTAPSRLNVGATLTMVNSRALQLSVKVLGFEAASVTVVGDSVWVVEKLHHTYVAESITELLHGFPADISNLQDLMLGRPFILGSPTLTAADARSLKLTAGSGDTAWTITAPRAAGMVDYHFDVAAGSPAGVVAAMVAEVAGRAVTARYSDFTSSPIGPVASAAAFSAATPSRRISAELVVKIDRAKVDRGYSVERPSTRGYNRVAAADLLKVFSNL